MLAKLAATLLNVGVLAIALWYTLGAYAVLVYARWAFIRGLSTIDVIQRVLGLMLIVIGFVIVHAALRRTWTGTTQEPPPSTTPRTSGLRFPDHITRVIGVWLLLFSVLSVVGFFVTLDSPPWLEQLFGSNEFEPIKEALLTLFAAGLGSAITTILAFLKHASDEKTFETAYAPWYVARPLMGLLLGLIFYLLLKGGLVATVGVQQQEPGSLLSDLNDWTVAGFGALVGLFSKNAIEKLREVFNTLFATSTSGQRNGDDGNSPRGEGQTTPGAAGGNAHATNDRGCDE